MCRMQSGGHDWPYLYFTRVLSSQQCELLTHAINIHPLVLKWGLELIPLPTGLFSQ